MSLKAFHILFIIASILLSIGFGVWCLQNSSSGVYLIMAVVSLLAGAGLVIYGVWFFKNKVGNKE
jgi:hypothetical protein